MDGINHMKNKNGQPTQDSINEILKQSEFRAGNVYGQTAMHCKLPNGFILHATSDDPNPVAAKALATKKIADQLYQFETYSWLNTKENQGKNNDDAE